MTQHSILARPVSILPGASLGRLGPVPLTDERRASLGIHSAQSYALHVTAGEDAVGCRFLELRIADGGTEGLIIAEYPFT